jgi:DNA sulfur modification protein DndB
MDDFLYNFPAIRGVQARREYYVTQCQLRLIPRLFQFDDPDLPAEVRAQRSLNRGRLPELSSYMLGNPESYVFSALTASIDAEVEFEPFVGEAHSGRLGMLKIPMNARFLINDGQHRRAAIEMALHEDPSLGEETIAVVFFLDRDLHRSQQMFADLNRYAVKPSASIGILYDHRDPLASVARAIVSGSSLLRDVVELEKSTLSPRSRRLFTLSAIFVATRALLSGIGDEELSDHVETGTAYWDGISRGFPEWSDVREGRLTAGEVRRDFIHSHGTVLHALGKVGCAVLAEGSPDWKDIGVRLGEMDWRRSNSEIWAGRAMIAGRVSKSMNNVTLTTNAVKAHLGLELSPEEQRIEDAHLMPRKEL